VTLERTEPGRLDSVEDAKFGVVSTILANQEDAQDLAKDIIESRLAACVQLMPVHSTYRWQGKVETAAEHLLTAKTLIVRAVELMAFIRTRHSYDVPEIILVPIIGGSQTYLDWMEREASG
jgi:periplasmic divalent cation tolerance protein